MKTKEDLKEYIQSFDLENSLALSEEETISAIIGYDDESRALVYDYDKLVDAFVEHFRKSDPDKDEEELVNDAIDWISYNTLRSLPYKDADYISYNKDGEEVARIPIRGEESKKEAIKLAGEGGHIDTVNYVNPIVIYSCKDWDDYCAPKPYEFDAKKVKNELVQWIKDWFEENGKGCNAVIGLSGGKDSTIVAALCVEALGKDRVIGVSMPDKGQGENEAMEIAGYLGIRYEKIAIDEITAAFGNIGKRLGMETLTTQSTQNVPPRARMMVEYFIAQNFNGRPSCNCNLSEDYVGYATLYGDSAGSFAPLSRLTVTEIKQIGKELGLPMKWVDKTPDDGLPFSTSDEAKFGFTYATLDKFIREGVCEDEEIRNKIIDMHNKNIFKVQMIRVPSYDPDIPVKA